MRHIQNPVKSALRTALQCNGFAYSKGNWIRHYPNLTQLVHLDKSPFGERYFVNVAIFFRELNSNPELKEWKGDYRFRFCDRIVSGVDRLLDFEDHDQLVVPGSEAGGPVRIIDVHDYNVVATDEERETRLREIFEQSFVPLLCQMSTDDELRDAYITGRVRNVAIVRDASLYLFGNETPPRPQGV